MRNQRSDRRLRYLDGLRGVAALAVVIHHFISGYAPSLEYSVAHGLANGSFAVCVFYVISGFVMSSASDRGDEPFLLRIAKRYLRLALPMIAASIVAWMLIEIWPNAAREAGTLAGSSWAARGYWHGAPTLARAIADAITVAFTGGKPYADGVLWTMNAEFIGSVAIFVLCGFVPKPARLAVISTLAVAGTATGMWWILCFAAGALFWELKLQDRRPSGIGALAIVAGFFGAIIIWRLLSPMSDLAERYLFSVGAAALVAGILLSPAAQGVLRWRGTQFLGRISFGLYLIHLPLELTLFSALYVALQPTHLGLAALFAAFVAVSILAGWAMTKLADEPTLRMLKKLRLPNARVAMRNIGA